MAHRSGSLPPHTPTPPPPRWACAPHLFPSVIDAGPRVSGAPRPCAGTLDVSQAAVPRPRRRFADTWRRGQRSGAAGAARASVVSLFVVAGRPGPRSPPEAGMLFHVWGGGGCFPRPFPWQRPFGRRRSHHAALCRRSPWFNGWGFNLPRGQSLLDKWNLIPEGIDILMTHGPPLGESAAPALLLWGVAEDAG